MYLFNRSFEVWLRKQIVINVLKFLKYFWLDLNAKILCPHQKKISYCKCK